MSLSIQWPSLELHIFRSSRCLSHSFYPLTLTHVSQNNQELELLPFVSILPLVSRTLFGSLVSLILVDLEQVPCWPQPGSLGGLMETDDGEGPGSPAEFQLLHCWSPGKGADCCGQDRCLSWGSFVALSCSVATRWYTLPDLSLSSLIIPVICRLISMPSSPTQTTCIQRNTHKKFC